MPAQPTHDESQPTATHRADLPFADGGQIARVPLTKWLDWVTRNNSDVTVALPMIQRGSVWSAKKIAELWDSLLRGMPVGCLTVLRVDEPERMADFRTFDDKYAHKELPVGSLFLLDGQQRTLAMCIGWQQKTKDIDRRMWVDFGQPGVAGQPFRLRVTTENHPFGFNQNDHSKLTRQNRRLARKQFNVENADLPDLENKRDYDLPLSKTLPYEAKLPLELRSLIHDWQEAAPDFLAWSKKTLAKLKLSEDASKDEIATRVRNFGDALNRLFNMEIALVRVDPKLVVSNGAESDENFVPPLIVLFNRIANAGEPLSPSDYVFSLIKHRFPAAHNLVQDLHAEGHVASLLSANDLVMTAVRLALNTNKRSDGTEFTDNPTPNPNEFGRILKMKVDAGNGDFLENALMPLIDPAGPFALHKAFREAQRLLAFREDFPVDPGLPKLAFPLLQRQLVQVLVFWIHRRQRAAAILTEKSGLPFDASRDEILRFVLFWLLCVENREKEKELAGKIAFKILRESEHELFPGEEIYKQICEAKLALPLQRPESLERTAISSSTSDANIRSNDARFYRRNDDGTVTESQPLYRRWFFRKELLLWLQRKTLVVEFIGANPLAGRDEETPYDYDHICPSADWGTDYRSCNFALKKYCEYEQAWVVGNCIGNYRIEESSSNRHNQDDPAPCKLGLTEMDSAETQKLLENSAITREETDGWKACSVAKDDQGCWDEARALAFQEAVETRAFRLFKQYFNEGGFDEWVK